MNSNPGPIGTGGNAIGNNVNANGVRNNVSANGDRTVGVLGMGAPLGGLQEKHLKCHHCGR